jgi:dCTP deaminase
MILSHEQLTEFVDNGGIKSPDGIVLINGASINLRLDSKIKVESRQPMFNNPVTLGKSESLTFDDVTIDEQGFSLYPNAFILASTIETINLPCNLSAFVCLRSSSARNGLEHLNAGFIDPCFNGTITLELKNMTNHHILRILPLMDLVQITIHENYPVASEYSYAKTGRYQHQQGVTEAR